MNKERMEEVIEMIENLEEGDTFEPYKLFYGVWMPDIIFNDPNLSWGAKACYARLLKYYGKEGDAHPSLRKLAKDLNVTKRCAQGYIKQLEEEGWIKVERPEGIDKVNHRVNRYYFRWKKILLGCLRDEYKRELS